jgi:hypothetical protein
MAALELGGRIQNASHCLDNVGWVEGLDCKIGLRKIILTGP